ALRALADSGGTAEGQQLDPEPGKSDHLGRDRTPGRTDGHDLAHPSPGESRLEQQAPDQLHPSGDPVVSRRAHCRDHTGWDHTGSSSPSAPRNAESILESRPSTRPHSETATHPASSTPASSTTSTLPEAISVERARRTAGPAPGATRREIAPERRSGAAASSSARAHVPGSAFQVSP